MGCAAAYFLNLAGVSRVCVIEPDPTYAKAATPLATGGCRRLFSRPENIRMSQFSIEFFKAFGEHVAANGDAPDVQWREHGCDPTTLPWVFFPRKTDGSIRTACSRVSGRRLAPWAVIF